MELVVDMIDIIDARMIIYSGDDVKISELREKCNNIVFLKIEDTNCNDDIEFVNQSDLILSKTSSDPAVILFTSGTTGKMKAVVHSHENIIVNVNAVDDYMNINKNMYNLYLIFLYQLFFLKQILYYHLHQYLQWLLFLRNLFA